MDLSKVLRLASLACLVAITLSLLSVFVERRGPELAAYGNLCGPTSDEPCNEPVLKGGFPFAYLFDVPGVSVEHQLAWVQDEFRPIAWALDVVFYFTVAMALFGSARNGCRSAGDDPTLQSSGRRTTSAGMRG